MSKCANARIWLRIPQLDSGHLHICTLEHLHIEYDYLCARMLFGLFGGKKKEKTGEENEMSFLRHLEALRWHLVRSVLVILTLAIVAFFFKDILFDGVVFAPARSDFPTYRILCNLSHQWGMGDSMCFTFDKEKFRLINTSLMGPFTLHMWAAFVAGLILGFPYLLWELWRFVSPALRDKEKTAARGFIGIASALFMIGVLFSYYIIVPMAVYFLGNYEISKIVVNFVDIDSYISTVTTLVLIMGILFELPILVYFLARFGVMSSRFMSKYRKHAVVIILIIAAVITPTSDIFTQTLVALPLWILYESSIYVAKYVERKYRA